MRRLPVRHEGSLIYINVPEIEWIEGADYYARVHARKRAFLVREPLSALEKRLDPSRFFRTHRSAIINLDYVRELQPMFQGEAVAIMHGGARVRIARPRRAALERAMEGGIPDVPGS
jgi:two-component system, LytTR family, response regulator